MHNIIAKHCKLWVQFAIISIIAMRNIIVSVAKRTIIVRLVLIATMLPFMANSCNTLSKFAILCTIILSIA